MANISLKPVTYQERRKIRRPEHRWRVNHRPFEICPIAIAPVLPGETLKNLLWQSRSVTDPIKNRLCGWHLEYYWFYVKITDMQAMNSGTLPDDFRALVLNPGADLSTYDGATDAYTYHANGTDIAVNWTQKCLLEVTERYFRNEGESYNTAVHATSSYPKAGIVQNNFMDSAMDDADLITAVDSGNLVDAGSMGGTAVTAAEIEQAMRAYELAKTMNLVDMTFEDFLGTYGVRLPNADQHKPELIRYMREWQYPSNTVEPTTGVPTSAVSWSIAGRGDKDRFFREPGFIFGCTVARPKVYLKNLTSSAVMLMRDAKSWLPAVMSDDPHSSLVKVTAGDPPLDSNTDAYWVDIKDLLIYGDQFLNESPSTMTEINGVTLPLADLSHAAKNYPSDADLLTFFVDDDDSEGKTKVRQDGVVSLTIASHRAVDTTPNYVGVSPTN